MICANNKLVTLPLQPYSSYLLCGPTNSGKTTFTKRFISECKHLFEKNPPEKVLYCYGVHQPLFESMEKEIENIEFHEGLPLENTLDEYADGKHLLIVLDDLMNSVLNSELAEKLFVQSCHHKGFSVVYISQNLYQKGKFSRAIGLNCTYMCLFRNARDTSQINCLARQMYPGESRMFMEAYQDCTSKMYGYLFIDLSPHSDPQFRLRTNIFVGEDPFVYMSK